MATKRIALDMRNSVGMATRKSNPVFDRHGFHGGLHALDSEQERIEMPRTAEQAAKQQLTVMTQGEVARILGISTMRVCQIEQIALAKIAIAVIRLRRKKTVQ